MELQEGLRNILTMPYSEVIKLGEYDKDGDFTLIKREGAKVLALCHADWVRQDTNHVPTFWYRDAKKEPENMLVFSRALDDRLGLFVLLYLLKDLPMDILICNDEEKGASTAKNFKMSVDRKYNWAVEFDRRGTDVVLYGYEHTTPNLKSKLEAVGFTIGHGSYSDIASLNIGRGAFNVGVGYHSEHTDDCYVYLIDTAMQIVKFKEFFKLHSEEEIPSSFNPTPKYEHTSWKDWRDYDYQGGLWMGAYDRSYVWDNKVQAYKKGDKYFCYRRAEYGVYKFVEVDIVDGKVVDKVIPPATAPAIIETKREILVPKKEVRKASKHGKRCPICVMPSLHGWECDFCGDLSTLTCEYCGTNPHSLKEAKYMFFNGLCFSCRTKFIG